MVASSAMPLSGTATTMNVAASVGDTRKSSDSRYRVSSRAPSAPRRETGRRPHDAVPDHERDDAARGGAERAAAPYTPTAVNTTASSANAPSTNSAKRRERDRLQAARSSA